MRRIFAAIEVNPEPALLHLLSEAGSRFSRERIRWVRPEQMHLTLKFFGETPEEKIGEICSRFEGVAVMHHPFSCTLQGLGLFGSRYAPRVVWAGIRDDAPLRQLGEDVLDASSEAGFPRERLPFVPHLTLGRIAAVQNKKGLSDWISAYRDTTFQVLRVNRFILFESKLKSTGALYTEICTFLLPSQSG
ncbi:MAG: RNA 2',3'-cyclic phosphodiesterase [Bacteroidales bacterium]